jgi:hypothetical protein
MFDNELIVMLRCWLNEAVMLKMENVQMEDEAYDNE